MTTNELLEWPRWILHGILCALLPAPERQRHAWRHGIDAPRWSLAFGLLQGGLGAALFIVFGLAFTRGVSGDLSTVLLENWDPSLTSTHFRGTGLIGWLGWLIWPGSWPWSYLALVGLVRCIAFAITREAVGEPIVVPLVRVLESRRRRRAEQARRLELGPPRADRLQQSGGQLLVVSAREKRDWEPGSTTVEIDGRYFLVVGVEERFDGRWVSLVYRLRPADATAAIRRFVHYRPASAVGGAAYSGDSGVTPQKRRTGGATTVRNGAEDA